MAGIPTPPDVKASGHQFIITVSSDEIPVDATEWDLQYQSSLDNSQFTDWKDIGTLPFDTTTASDVYESEFNDDQVIGVYTHSDLEVTPPLPYYRYRYRIHTNKTIGYWSAPAFAGQVQNVADSLDLPDNSVDGSFLMDDTVDGGAITTGTLDATAIVSQSITADQIHYQSLTGDKIITNTLDASAITSGTITTQQIGVGAIKAGQIDVGGVTAGTIDVGAINASNLFVKGVINGNAIGQGEINGVHIAQGAVDATKISGQTITAAQMQTGFFDANVSVNSYIDASAITGGQLSLGGPNVYHNFVSNSGDLIWPWSIQGAGLTYASYPRGPTPTTQRYSLTWAAALGITLVPNAVIPSGESLKFTHARANNRIMTISFTITYNLPTGVRVELVDDANNNRPITAPWFRSGSGTETQTLSMSQAIGLPSSLAFQLRATAATTVPGTGSYSISISNVTFTYEKGNGNLNIYDNSGLLRGELTADYIKFNKVTGVGSTANVFKVDSTGTWIPADGLTIGSTNISNLAYNQRDLSGSLVINARFENLRITADPTTPTNLKQLPADWTFIGPSGNVDETQFAYNEGVYPQAQSLVSGRTMTMTVPSGYTNASGTFTAVSHKRYIEAQTALSPLSASVYVRTALSDPDTQMKISVYSTTSASDITKIGDITTGTSLLGSTTIDGTSVSSIALDGSVAFKQMAISFSTNPGMVVSAQTGVYVFVVLQGYIKTGRSATTVARMIEWDNVDLSITEKTTPSDNQPIADLTRQMATVQTILTYAYSGSKCVLPDPSTGTYGLQMTAVW